MADNDSLPAIRHGWFDWAGEARSPRRQAIALFVALAGLLFLGWYVGSNAISFNAIATVGLTAMGVNFSRGWWLLLTIVFCGILYYGLVTGERAAEESRQDVKRLTVQVQTLAAGLAAGATKDDMKSLGDSLGNRMDGGFSRVVDAINGKPQTSVSTSTTLPPPVVQNVRFSQRRVPSLKPEMPFALQVVIQTDLTIQNPALQIDFDGPIAEASFFVAGQPALMSMRTLIAEDRKSFALAFGYPAWAPESPIVVTVLSKEAVQVIGIGTPPN